MESAILLNSIIAILDETSEGANPIGFIHRDMNVNDVSIHQAKNTQCKPLGTQYSSIQSIQNAKKRLHELSEIYERDKKINTHANIFVGGAVLTSRSKHDNNHHERIYDVKYNALIMYMLADMTSKRIVNFDMVNSLFLKYLHFEIELMEKHLCSHEYVHDVNSGIIFPRNFIQDDKSEVYKINIAVLSSFRLLAFVKIIENFSKYISCEQFLDWNVRGLFIRHLENVVDVVDLDVFKKINDDPSTDCFVIKMWELQLFNMALTRVTNHLDAMIKLDDTNKDSTNTDVSKDYTVEKLLHTLEKTSDAATSISLKLESLSILHNTSEITDRSGLIPFVLMTDDELLNSYVDTDTNAAKIRVRERYITSVYNFLEKAKEGLPVYIPRTESVIGLVGCDGSIDVVLSVLTYSRLYRLMGRAKPLIDIDDMDSFLRIKQNIMYLINRFDVNFCKKMRFRMYHLDRTFRFGHCSAIPYIVPLSVVYSIVNTVLTTVSDHAIFKNIDLNYGRIVDTDGYLDADDIPLLPETKKNDDTNYGTRTIKNTTEPVRKTLKSYSKKFKRPITQISKDSFYPIEKIEKNRRSIRSVSMEDMIFTSSIIDKRKDSEKTETVVEQEKCKVKYCGCRYSIYEEQDPLKNDTGVENNDVDNIFYSVDVYKSIETKSIITVDDLISLGKTYHCQLRTHFKGIDLKIVAELVDPLHSFNQMKGLNEIKQKIVNNVLFFLKKGKQPGQIWNIAIYGPPGVGKTTIAKHIANVYSKAGILATNKVESIKRSDLIGRYLGETAIKTQDVINRIRGGVLLIDEVYSLGHFDKRDSFSKECLDTLTHNLGQEDTDFICIVAGYEEDVKNCFFAQNKGLQRRFPFVYRVDDYDNKVMGELMLSKLRSVGWSIDTSDEDTLTRFIEKNRDKFSNFMGDVETFILRLEIVHNSSNIFSDSPKILTENLLQRTMDDIHQQPRDTKNKDNESWRKMYL